MPKYICDDCGAHFPTGFNKCPKCETKDFKLGRITQPVKDQSLEDFHKVHAGHEFKSIKVKKTTSILIKCLDCNLYYLL